MSTSSSKKYKTTAKIFPGSFHESNQKLKKTLKSDRNIVKINAVICVSIWVLLVHHGNIYDIILTNKHQ